MLLKARAIVSAPSLRRNMHETTEQVILDRDHNSPHDKFQRMRRFMLFLPKIRSVYAYADSVSFLFPQRTYRVFIGCC